MAGTSSRTDPQVSSDDFTPAAVVEEEPVASTSKQIMAGEQHNVDEHDSYKESIESIYKRELLKSIHDIFGESSSENEDQVDDLHVNNKSKSDGASSLPFPEVKRGPNKRQIKPSSHPEMIDLDNIFGENSSDSDFCVEDHYVNNESDSAASNLISSEDESQGDANNDDEDTNVKMSNDSIVDENTNVVTIDQDNSKKIKLNEIVDKIRICSVCLGDASDNVNEIIDCDECGISVHEDCYGVQNSDDAGSTHSSLSTYSTEPWFCEPCIAGIKNPTCELCPNFGGIFKETDYGRWVHLVCALYVPGTLFGDGNKITLFSNTTPKWGSKRCDLCKDVRFMYTGVTIPCDAGMCRTNFHVTCAQQEGSLSEATSPESDKTDPFYGHCKLHVDKFTAKKKKRNWEILQLRTTQMKLLHEQQFFEKSATWQRNQQILEKARSKYNQMKKTSKPILTVKSKIARPITSSASACRALSLKASLMGINLTSQEAIETQIKTLRDVPKKCHMSPAFSLEYVSYFFDRNTKITHLKNKINDLTAQKSKLLEEQIITEEKYNQALNNYKMQKQKLMELKKTILAYHSIINLTNPNTILPDIDTLIKECNIDKSNVKNGSTSTLAALKQSVGFSMRHDNSPVNIDHEMHLKLNNKCGICNLHNDQHLLAKCDVCNLYYHLGCLDPPLSRMPKKTKFNGWQCSECNNIESNCEQTVNPISFKQLKFDDREQSTSGSPRSSSINNDNSTSLQELKLVSGTSNRTKCRRSRVKYSPELLKSYKRAKSRKYNRKQKQDTDLKSETANDLINEPPRPRIKILIRSIPSADNSKITHLVVTPPVDEIPQTFTNANPKKRNATKIMSDEKLNKCNICNITEMCSTMIQCDECSNYFHLRCLVPPLKKSPKLRGYSWHCTECDTTDSSD